MCTQYRALQALVQWNPEAFWVIKRAIDQAKSLRNTPDAKTWKTETDVLIH